jgi:hypothetical protein
MQLTIPISNSYWTQLPVSSFRGFLLHDVFNENAGNFSNGGASLVNVLDGDFEGGIAVVPEPGSFRHVEPGRSLPSCMSVAMRFKGMISREL